MNNPKQTTDCPSALLRKAADEIGKIGKEIEDSQVEDGDPPYRVTHRQMNVLKTSIGKCQKAVKHLTTAGEIGKIGKEIEDSQVHEPR